MNPDGLRRYSIRQWMDECFVLWLKRDVITFDDLLYTQIVNRSLCPGTECSPYIKAPSFIHGIVIHFGWIAFLFRVHLSKRNKAKLTPYRPRSTSSRPPIRLKYTVWNQYGGVCSRMRAFPDWILLQVARALMPCTLALGLSEWLHVPTKPAHTLVGT